MLYLATLLIGLAIGYFLRDVLDRLKTLEKTIETKVDKKEPKQEPKSFLYDPDDPIQQAQLEMKQRMKEINPGVYDEE